MERTLDDARVVDRSLREPRLFAELYERHAAAVQRYVARRVGMSAAEDLAAEVFVRSFKGRDRCRCDHGSARPWLLGIANHVIADHRRAERRRLGALSQLARGCATSIENPDSSFAPELVEALRKIPAADRDALLLVVWGELSYEEAATALDIPVGTVRSRISRARARLTATLGPRRRSLRLASQMVQDVDA